MTGSEREILCEQLRVEHELEARKKADRPAKRAGWFLIGTCALVLFLMTL